MIPHFAQKSINYLQFLILYMVHSWRLYRGYTVFCIYWSGSMKKKRLGTGKIAFRAREDAIRKKIEAGYTVAMLHDEYKNEIEIEYGQFLNYVNRYIRRKPEEIKAETRPKKPDQGIPKFEKKERNRDDLV